MGPDGPDHLLTRNHARPRVRPGTGDRSYDVATPLAAAPAHAGPGAVHAWYGLSHVSSFAERSSISLSASCHGRMSSAPRSSSA